MWRADPVLCAFGIILLFDLKSGSEKNRIDLSGDWRCSNAHNLLLCFRSWTQIWRSPWIRTHSSFLVVAFCCRVPSNDTSVVWFSLTAVQANPSTDCVTRRTSGWYLWYQFCTVQISPPDQCANILPECNRNRDTSVNLVWEKGQEYFGSRIWQEGLNTQIHPRVCQTSVLPPTSSEKRFCCRSKKNPKNLWILDFADPFVPPWCECACRKGQKA